MAHAVTEEGGVGQRRERVLRLGHMAQEGRGSHQSHVKLIPPLFVNNIYKSLVLKLFCSYVSSFPLLVVQ